MFVHVGAVGAAKIVQPNVFLVIDDNAVSPTDAHFAANEIISGISSQTDDGISELPSSSIFLLDGDGILFPLAVIAMSEILKNQL